MSDLQSIFLKNEEALYKKYGSPGFIPSETDYSWLRKTFEMAKSYNSVSLIFQDEPIVNAYNDPDYIPSQDPLLQSNEWISSYYPHVWTDLQRSKSGLYTRSIIDNVKRNHASSKIMASGSFFGSLTGSIVAGFFDPINWLFPSVGLLAKSKSLSQATVNSVKSLKAAQVAEKTAKLSAKQRAIYAGLDNMVVTSVLEPWMQAKNLTRTESDYLNDLIGSAVFGAGFGAGAKKFGDGLNKLREDVNLRLVGDKDFDTGVQKKEGEILQNVIDEAKEMAPEEGKKVLDRLNNIKDFLEVLRDDPETTKKDLEMFDRAFEKAFPKVGELKGLGNVAKWFMMNPNGQLFKSGSKLAIRFATDLLETNFEFEGGNFRVPIESKIKLVDFVMKRKINEFTEPFDTFATNHPELEMTPEDIRDLVYYLVISGKDKMHEIVDYKFMAETDGDVDFVHVIQRVSQKARELNASESLRDLAKVVNKGAKDYREIIGSIDSTLDSGGFLSSVFNRSKRNPLNLNAYISRWISEYGANNTPLFIKAVISGLEDQDQSLARELAADKLSIENYIKELEAELQHPDLSNYDRAKRSKTLDKQKEKLELAEEAIKEHKRIMSDPIAKKNFAESIVNNYTLDYNKTIVGTRSGGYSSTVQETLARKVTIDDKYLAPFVVRDPAAILDKARLHLLPKVVFADELLNKYGAGALEEGSSLGYHNFNRQLKAKVEELEKAQQKIEKLYEEGESPTEQDAADVKNLIDEVLDDVATSRLINELVMIKNIDRLNENIQGSFDTLDLAVRKVLEMNEKRKSSRKEASDVLVKIKDIEGEIASLANDKRLKKLLYKKHLYEKRLAEIEIESGENPTPVYEEHLIMYVPLPDSNMNAWHKSFKSKYPHLNANNRIDDAKILVSISKPNKKTGAITITHQVEINGKKANIKIKEGEAAQSFEEGSVWVLSDEVPLLYFEVGSGKNKKWGWVNPLNLKQQKRIEIAKRLEETTDVTLRSKLSARLNKAANESPEFVVDDTSLLLADEYIRNKEGIRRHYQKLLDKANKEVDTRIENLGDSGLKTLDTNHRNAWSLFRRKVNTMHAYRDGLNEVADGVYKVHKGKRDLEDMGLAMPSYRTIASKEDFDNPESIFSYIGYEDNFRYYDQFGWNPKGLGRTLDGALDIDMRIGASKFEGDLYNTSFVAFAQQRKNNAFILNPSFMLAAMVREGTIAQNSSEMSNVASNLSFIFRQLQNQGEGNMVDDKYMDAQKFLRIVRNMNYMRYMGMVTVSSLGDFSNAIGTLGFTRYARTLVDVYGDFKNRKNQNSIASVVAAADAADIQTRNTQFFGVDASATYVDPVTGNPYTTGRDTRLKRGLDAVDRGTSGGSWIMNKFQKWGNGLSMWNAFNKRVVSFGLEDMLIDIAVQHAKGGKISKRDMGIIKGLRFSEDDLKEIYRRWKKVDEQSPGDARKKKIIGRDFYKANSQDWDDNFGYHYLMKVQAAVDTIIVTPSIGDLPQFMKNPYIAPFFQFKSFMFASTTKLMLPAVQRAKLYKDPNQLMMVFGSAMLGTLSYILHESVGGRDWMKDSVSVDEETGKETRVSWVTKALLQGIDRGGTFALLFGMSNSFERHIGLGFHSLLGGQLDDRYRSRTFSDTIMGPLGSFFSDTIKTAAIPFDLIRGNDLTESQLTSARRMIPMQNGILIKAFGDAGLSALDALSRPGGFTMESNYRQYMDNFKTVQGRAHQAIWGD